MLICKECLELYTQLLTVGMTKAFTMHRIKSLKQLVLKYRSMVWNVHWPRLAVVDWTCEDPVDGT